MEPLPATPRRPASPLVGRRDELHRLRSLLAEGRLVTLVGGAGLGKTRLAVEVASGQAALFCELARCATPHDVCAEVIRLLDGAPPAASGEALYAQVGRSIARHGVRLVVLDNVEQIQEGLDRLLAAWLTEAAETAFLATSRRLLGIVDEQAFPLAPLPVPASRDAPRPRGGDAVDLFFARAAFGRAEVLDRRAAFDAVLDIVTRLEGIPLAIELAAARLEVLSLEGLRARLGEQLRLLRDPTAEGRHAALWNALDWSWRLLGSREQRVLRWLSVFADGFDLEAAVGVLGSSEAAEALGTLVDVHLVRAVETELGPRYSLLEVIREFADARLEETGERDAALARHADWFLDRAELWHDGVGRAGRDAEFVERLLNAHRNLEAVLRRALGGRLPEPALTALRAARVLAWSWRALYAPRHHVVLLDEVVSFASPQRLDPVVRHAYARVLLDRATLHIRHLDLDEGRADLAVALSECERAGDAGSLCDTQALLAGLERASGRRDFATRWYDVALATAEATGDPVRLGWTLARCGLERIAHPGGSDEGEALMRRGLDVLRGGGDTYHEARVLCWLGYASMTRCRLEEALGFLDRGIPLMRRLHIRDYEAEPLLVRANVHHMAGRLDEARQGYLEVIRVARETEVRQIESVALLYLGVVAGEQGLLEEAARCADDAMRPLAAGTEAASVGPIALLGMLRALCGQTEAARAVGDQVRAQRTPDIDEALARTIEAVLDLACAMDAPGPREAARSIADEYREYPSASVWIQVRVIDALLARADLMSRTWRVHPLGTRFRAPGGEPVDLSRRPLLATLCAELARARSGGSAPVKVDALAAVMWPETRLLPAVAQERVYGAVHALRALGLPIRRTRLRGYFLDPAAVVAWEDPPSDPGPC